MSNERANFSNLKVLVAEDYDFNLEIIKGMLELFEIKPDLASNGKEAVDKAKTGNYDLVLMDIQMPIMDGYQAAQEIRKLSLTQQPRIIALTASSALHERQQFIEVGMDDFLIKPIEIHELEKMLNKHFALKKAH